MKAIILAAGFGKRMRPLSEATHKTLLQVGGRTVIQWIVDALLDNGVTELVVVTGYRAEELREYLGRVYPALTVSYVHNSRYAQTNNIYSMALALEGTVIDSDILLIECDLIFEPAVIKRLLQSPHANVAVVDHYRAGMDGTVVEVSGDLITEVIVPKRQGSGFLFTGKFKTLNIYRFSREFCTGAFKKLLDYYIAVINENDYYEMVLGIIIYLQQEAVYAEVLQGERWTEIDDPNDMAVARFMFDPASRKKTLDEGFGGYWNYDVLDFCFLRNMYFPSGAIHSELRNSLPALTRNYGSTQKVLDTKLSHFLLCQAEPLTVLNGASQVYPVFESYFRGQKALVPCPTFGEYNRCFPDAARYADSAEPELHGCEVAVFVNPNNPTGTVLRTEWIYEYAARHPGQTIICDESFIEFSDQPSLIGVLERAPLDNVIVVKSMSKTLGVPGIRLGYVYTTNVAFRNALRQALPVWNLNSIAEHFLEIILKHRQAIEESYRQTKKDREEFRMRLSAASRVRAVWPSGGNFLLVELDGTREECARLTESILLDRGIYVKDVSQRFAGTGAYLRLAVRLPEENGRLVEALDREETWRSVWERRGALDVKEHYSVDELFQANGYDSPSGVLTVRGRERMVCNILRALRPRQETSLLEVGCGSGAILSMLRDTGAELTGVDFSRTLVELARRALPGLDIRIAEAAELPFPPDRFDAVLCHGVFLYFPSLEYAAGAMKEMLRVSRASVRLFITDVPDLDNKDQCLAKRRASGASLKPEHLFYSKGFFEEFATTHLLRATITDQNIPDYPNTPYRFNVLLESPPAIDRNRGRLTPSS